jgi:hypothetical protein
VPERVQERLEGYGIKTWPNNIPADLRRTLDGTLSNRSVNAATVWGDVVDWLRLHGIEPPDQRLPESPELEGGKP